jgi:hypothetical protein
MRCDHAILEPSVSANFGANSTDRMSLLRFVCDCHYEPSRHARVLLALRELWGTLEHRPIAAWPANQPVGLSPLIGRVTPPLSRHFRFAPGGFLERDSPRPCNRPKSHSPFLSNCTSLPDPP